MTKFRRSRWWPHWTELLGLGLALAVTIAGARSGDWVGAVAIGVVCVFGLAAWHVTFVEPPSPQPFVRPAWWGIGPPSLWSLIKGDGSVLFSRAGGLVLLLVGSGLTYVMLSASRPADMGAIGLVGFGAALLQIVVGLVLIIKPKRTASGSPPNPSFKRTRQKRRAA